MPSEGGSASASDSNNKQSVRSSKVSRACDHCRKKVKCDGPASESLQCTNCKLAKIDCLYVEEAKRRGPPKGYMESLENKIKRLENALLQLHPEANLEQLSGPKIIRDEFESNSEMNIASAPDTFQPNLSSIKEKYRSLKLPCSQAGGICPSFGPSDCVRDDDDITSGIMEKLRLMKLKDTSEHPRFSGPSSSFLLAIIATRFRSEALGVDPTECTNILLSIRRDKYWFLKENTHTIKDAILPDLTDDFAQLLISLYFKHVNPILPLFDEAIFRKHQIRFIQDVRVLPPGAPPDAWYAAGSHWHDAYLKSQVWTHSASTLWDLQGVVVRTKINFNVVFLTNLQLMAHYLNGTTDTMNVWSLVSIGLTLCVDLGIHRMDSPRWEQCPQENQLRKRLFWCLYTMDRHISATLGRHSHIRDDNFDLDQPINLAIRKDPTLEFLSASSQLSRLYGEVLQAVFPVVLPEIADMCIHEAVVKFYEVMNRMDAKMDLWLRSLPKQFQMSSYLSQESCLLHCRYYELKILLHRRNLNMVGRAPFLTELPSQEICYSSSTQILRILSRYQAQPGCSIGADHMSALFSSTLIYLIHAWGNREIGTYASLSLMQNYKDLFSIIEENFLCAGKFHDLITSLASTSTISDASPTPLSSESQGPSTPTSSTAFSVIGSKRDAHESSDMDFKKQKSNFDIRDVSRAASGDQSYFPSSSVMSPSSVLMQEYTNQDLSLASQSRPTSSSNSVTSTNSGFGPAPSLFSKTIYGGPISLGSDRDIYSWKSSLLADPLSNDDWTQMADVFSYHQAEQQLDEQAMEGLFFPPSVNPLNNLR